MKIEFDFTEKEWFVLLKSITKENRRHRFGVFGLSTKMAEIVLPQIKEAERLKQEWLATAILTPPNPEKQKRREAAKLKQRKSQLLNNTGVERY